MVREVIGAITSDPVFREEIDMDVNSVSRNTQALPASPTPVSAQAASQSRQVVQAVKALNKSEMFGEENGLEFAKDPDTQRLVVKVVNRSTGEVISQIPAEYILRLAEGAKEKGTADAQG
jgi:uncharacterized FlaG/YvyC family protein